MRWRRSRRSETAIAPSPAKRALEPGQDGQDLVEQRREAARVIEQSGDCAQEVAQQVARARNCRDVQDDLVQVYRETEQVEIEWTEYQIQDGTSGRDSDAGNCSRARALLRGDDW